MNWNVLGHQKQLDLLTRSLLNSKVAHAYVFAGPDGIGKKFIARQFAKHLLCANGASCNDCVQCRMFERSINPDFFELTPDGEYKIETIRDLISKLVLKPYSGRFKVAIIDEAENLNKESGNALLKSLEDPKGFTVVILITSNPAKILKTILSRSVKVNFGLVRFFDYQNMIPVKINGDEKRIVEIFGNGRPGHLTGLLANPEVMSTKIESLNFFDQAESSGLDSRLILANRIAELDNLELSAMFYDWLLCLQKKFYENPSNTAAKTLKALARAYYLAKNNVNSKLLTAELMLNWK